MPIPTFALTALLVTTQLVPSVMMPLPKLLKMVLLLTTQASATPVTTIPLP